MIPFALKPSYYHSNNKCHAQDVKNNLEYLLISYNIPTTALPGGEGGNYHDRNSKLIVIAGTLSSYYCT